MKHIKGELTYSKQSGTPGHCIAAQVFDEEKSIAVIEATENENDATETARLFHAADNLLSACLMAKEELCFGGDHETAKRILEEAIEKATN